MRLGQLRLGGNLLGDAGIAVLIEGDPWPRLRELGVGRNSITDGQVCDWVLKNVKQPDSVKDAHRERMLNYPKKDDAEMQARLKSRKEAAGMSNRDDIQTFVDFIDADEKRL